MDETVITLEEAGEGKLRDWARRVQQEQKTICLKENQQVLARLVPAPRKGHLAGALADALRNYQMSADELSEFTDEVIDRGNRQRVISRS